MAAENLQLKNFFMNLEEWGLTDVMLPFLLIFVIIFAILQKTKILGEGKKNLNVIVGIVTALLVVIPHVTNTFPPDADPVVIINNAIPQISLLLVAVIFLLILIGVFGQESVFLGMTAPGWVAVLSLVAIVLIFGGAAGWWPDGFRQALEDIFGTEAVAIVIMLLVFGVIVAWITSEPKEEKSWLKRIGIDLDKLFKK